MLAPMNPFTFQTVPRIIQGIGAAADTGAILKNAFPGNTKVMIVTDPGFLQTGLVNQV